MPTLLSTIVLATALAPGTLPAWLPADGPLLRYPTYPDQEQCDGTGGDVVVRSQYSESGQILSTEIARSSGNRYLDFVAQVALLSSWVYPGKIQGSYAAGDVNSPMEFRPMPPPRGLCKSPLRVQAFRPRHVDSTAEDFPEAGEALAPDLPMFAPNEDVDLQLMYRLEGDKPGPKIKARWYDAQGSELAKTKVESMPGEHIIRLHATAPGAGWPVGIVRINVEADGQNRGSIFFFVDSEAGK